MRFGSRSVLAVTAAATFLLVVAAPLVFAQGTITGRVVGGDSKVPLEGARVMGLGGLLGLPPAAADTTSDRTGG